MPFTLENRYAVLSTLNKALIRNQTVRQAAERLYYEHNKPQDQAKPLLFEEGDIFSRLEAIETKSEYLVQQVLEVMQQLATVEKNITAQRTSANYALTRVGDMAYEISLKTAGMEEQRSVLINELRYHLDLPLSPPEQIGGTLGRS